MEEANRLIELSKKQAAATERQAQDKAQAMLAGATAEGDRIRQQSQNKATAMVSKVGADPLLTHLLTPQLTLACLPVCLSACISLLTHIYNSHTHE